MVLNRTYVALAVVLSLGISGCYYDVEEELYPNSFCDVTNVTYAGDIQPLMASSCAIPGCHVPGVAGRVDLSTYAGVFANKGPIRTLVFETHTMPQGGSLSSCEMKQLDAWLTAGAAQN